MIKYLGSKRRLVTHIMAAIQALEPSGGDSRPILRHLSRGPTPSKPRGYYVKSQRSHDVCLLPGALLRGPQTGIDVIGRAEPRLGGTAAGDAASRLLHRDPMHSLPLLSPQEPAPWSTPFASASPRWNWNFGVGSHRPGGVTHGSGRPLSISTTGVQMAYLQDVGHPGPQGPGVAHAAISSPARERLIMLRGPRGGGSCSHRGGCRLP
jgi:hypothetical protein